MPKTCYIAYRLTLFVVSVLHAMRMVNRSTQKIALFNDHHHYLWAQAEQKFTRLTSTMPFSRQIANLSAQLCSFNIDLTPIDK